MSISILAKENKERIIMCNIPITGKDGKPIEWEQAKGFSKYLISTDGQIYSIVSDKLIVPGNKNNIKNSYLVATLYDDEGKARFMLVHRLVYMAHKGEIPKGLQVNHKDENKENNHIDNLELMTNKENCNYGSRNARISKAARKTWSEKHKLLVG